MADHAAVKIPAYPDPIAGTRGGALPPIYLMQANDSITRSVFTWTAVPADFAGTGYPGPNAPLNVAIAIKK